MTQTQKALAIIRDHEIELPSQFADLMWPNSPARHVSYKCGPYGSSRGIALNRAAGAFLGRLRKQGLIVDIPSRHHRPLIVLTGEGYTVLKRGEE